MELQDALRYRRTTRAYTDDPVSAADLAKIIDAAQLAPVALGDDVTTHLIVVRDDALIEEIRAVCARTKKDGSYHDSLYGAKTLILVAAGDISSDHIEYCNVACLVENMALAATDLGLGSTYIWGCLRRLRKAEDTMAKLKIPEGFEVLSAIAIGHAKKPLERRDPIGKYGVTYL